MASIKLKHSGGNGVIIAAPTSNPASDKTLTLPSDVDGTVVSKDSSNSLQNIAGINGGQLGNRNLVVNGGCLVSQRGTSSTSTGVSTVDRIFVAKNGTDEDPTYSQVDVAAGTTPYTSGFRKAFKVTNGNQTSGAGTSDRIEIMLRLEAQDIANSGWNYVSSSSNITLSFWIKSSVAQNFFGRFETQDGTKQSNAFETGSLSADTWTKITKTFTGDSNITINNDNGEGLRISIYAFLGTDYTDSISLNTWAASAGASRTPDNTSTWYTTNDATLEITGLQLEVGSTATDFEHRSFGQELALCQRYYYQTWTTSEAGYYFLQYSASFRMMEVFHPVPMRATPTVSFNLNADSSTAFTSNEYQYKAYINKTYSDNASRHTDGTFTASAEL